MENIFIITLACIFSIVSSSPIYNGRQSFFQHRGEAIERRSSGDDPNQQNIANQWIKRYYHAKNPELDKEAPNSASVRLNTPDEFLWLMKDLLNQQGHGNDEADRYAPAAPSQDDVDRLRFPPFFNEDEDNTDGAIDYRDIYSMGPTLTDPALMEDNFQQTLTDYLREQNAQLEEQDNQQSEVNAEDTITKKAQSIVETPTEHPTNLGSSTLSILSAPVEVTSEATPSTAVTSSLNNLSVMPPVSIGKGQKEFAMLRPASDNNRKFDNWAQNFEKSMTQDTIDELQHPTIKQQYPVDSLTAELNKLKSQSRHGIKKSEPMWH